MLTRRSLIRQACPALLASRLAEGRQASVRFAAISDVQYADRDAAAGRAYRDSLAKLEAAAVRLAQEKLDFSIHLGDLIDGGAENAARVLPVFRRLPRPRHLVLGNHDFFGPRDTVLRTFGMARAWYDFRQAGWRFVVLDGMQVSVSGGWPEGSPQLREARATLAALKQRSAPNAQEWNGAVGSPQRDWLRLTLDDAARRRERVIVFCHFPVLPAATTPPHLLWDYEQVLDILDHQSAVAAYICGHDHKGGYAERNGIHHITLRGVVENDLSECLRVIELSSAEMKIGAPRSSAPQVLAISRMA